MAVSPPVCDFGWKAPDFTLPGTDGCTWSLDQIAGPKGTLIMFICNHCPYVQAVMDRIVHDAAALQAEGIGVAAISSNDATAYPADSFANMAAEAQRHGFCFPYLYDESQAVARAYDAACTPDFFGFNNRLELQYRGRLDASGRQPAGPEVKRELYEAMRLVARTGKGPDDQIASLGCSIKWRAA
ncbi:thioredoxin family protein [Frigidibacter sp. SD6-1]|uniref:thioredoxin family protein n=1 Tax=Frigidibacter sp. SD6-1 TaxID=3032581 RepID=UPI0024E030E6|nr:thioredoxin family protein [Frigidibacter sp. SD6-1]